MERKINEILCQVNELWFGLNKEEQRNLMMISEDIAPKYDRTPWVYRFVKNGKETVWLPKNNLLKTLNSANLRSILVFVDCYNKLKGTNIKIEIKNVPKTRGKNKQS